MTIPDADDLRVHADFLRRLALGLLASPDVADDAVQETFLVALHRSPAAGVGLRAWLSGVLKNVVRNVRRGQRRRQVHEARATARVTLTPEAIRERENLRRRLIDAVLTLPDALREALLLRYDQGLAPREVAARTGSPVATVHDRLRRGLAALRERLEQDAPQGAGRRHAQRARGTRAALAGLVEALPEVATGAWGGGLLVSKTWVVAAVALVAFSVVGVSVALRGADERGRDVPLPVNLAPTANAPVGGAPAPRLEGAASEAHPSLAASDAPRVFGWVEDARDGRPIAGAAVQAFGYDLRGPVAAQSTDAAGAFELPETRGARGALHAVVRHPEFAPATLDRVQASREALRVRLHPASWIVGRLTFGPAAPPSSGSLRVQALARATALPGELPDMLRRDLVQVLPLDLRPGASAPVHAGAFRVGPLAAGLYSVVVLCDGLPPLEIGGATSYEDGTGVTLAPGQTVDLGEVEVPALTRVRLSVLDGESEQPILGAEFSGLHEMDRAELAVPLEASPAEPPGTYAVACLQDSRLVQTARLRVSAPGYGSDSSTYVNHFDDGPLVVRLFAVAALEGVLVGDDGRALAAALVLVRQGVDEVPLAWSATDERGAFAFPVLPSRRELNVVAFTPGARDVFALAAVRLAPRETRRLNLGGPGGTALMGTLTRGGEPLVGVPVTLEGPDDVRIQVVTQASGRFAFAGLEPGRQRLHAWLGPSGGSVEVRPSLAAGQTLRLNLALDEPLAGRLEVRTLDGAARERKHLPPDLEVQARHVAPDGTAWIVEAHVESDEQGSFRLALPTCVGPASWSLSVLADEALTLEPVVVRLPRVAEAAPVVVPVVVDPRDGSLELVVLDALSGAPLPDATYQGAYGRASSSGTMAGDATVRLQGASLGTYVYWLHGPRHVSAQVRFALTPAQRSVRREVRLERSNAVRVESMEPAGAAAQAGLRAGDLLLRHRDAPLLNVGALQTAVESTRPSETVDVELWRDGSVQRLRVRGGRLGVRAANAHLPER